MKKLVFSLCLLSLSILGEAQKIIDDSIAQKRTVGSFHGISVSTGIKLMLTEGSTEEVVISANKSEYRDKIVTEVENGILKIHYDNKLGAISTRKEKKELKAYVSYKMLDELNANTGAIVTIEGVLKASSLKMKANTGSTVTGQVKVDDLEVDQNTGSVVSLSGEAGKFSFDGDLGAVFKGIDLKTNVSAVTATTGATVSITVQKELYAKANTGGTVRYKGDANTMNIKTGTGGSITKM